MAYSPEVIAAILRRAKEIEELTAKAKEVRSIEVTTPDGYTEIPKFEVWVACKLTSKEKEALWTELSNCVKKWRHGLASKYEDRRDWIVENFNNYSLMVNADHLCDVIDDE